MAPAPVCRRDNPSPWQSVGLAGIALLGALLVGCGVDPAAGRPPPPDAGADAETAEVVDAGGGEGYDGGQRGDGDIGASGDLVDDGGGDAAEPRRHRGPPYPVVLAHGFAGFDHLADLQEVPYYWDVREALERAGEEVVIGEVDPFNGSRVRGRQLLEQIAAYTAETGFEKVNIIGHSQGGLDARYVAHQRPDLVASVVTVSAPHRGTQISDIVLGLIDHPLFSETVDAVVRLFGSPIYDASGEESSMVEGLRQFTDEEIADFNREITDRPGVFYASVAGRTDYHLGGEACETPDAPEFIREWSLDGDPVDAYFSVTETILDGSTGGVGHPNDGLVRVDSAKWGTFLGCVPADHLDEIGQLFGDEPGVANTWDHVQFYVDLVEYLHRRGL